MEISEEIGGLYLCLDVLKPQGVLGFFEAPAVEKDDMKAASWRLKTDSLDGLRLHSRSGKCVACCLVIVLISTNRFTVATLKMVAR